MLYFVTTGMVLGLSAGLAPGPLTALVIAETLRHDARAGVKVAVAPLITDLPIILFSIVVLTQLSKSDILLAAISFCGTVFIARMGLQNMTMKGVDPELTPERQYSFRRGIITNLLSPHPYIFWLTVGIPIMGKAMRQQYWLVAVFLMSFYLLLVGTKIFLAVLVGKSRAFLSTTLYLMIMRGLGVILLLIAALLFYEGVSLLQH